MARRRRQQLQYSDRYPDPRSRGRYHQPMRAYRRRDESCVERFLHFLLIVGIIGLSALLLGFVVTHFQQTMQFIAAVFRAISFLILIFPLILRVVGILIAVFAVLGVFFGVVKIWTTISRSLAIASAERAKAATLKAKAKQERERTKQSALQVQRDQVKLAREAFDQDQHQRDKYRSAQGEGQQPHRTRVLTRPIEEAPQPQPQQQPASPASAPSVSQLLKFGAIRAGQTDMLYGFEIVNGKLEVIRGELPVTAIIGGRGRSGKTRRMMLMIFQALLIVHATGGGRVTICDPHYVKDDGLAKVLAAFAPWVHFALTESAIVAAAKEHITELESRLTPAGSVNGEGRQVRLLVIDEFSKLMKSTTLSKKDKQILTMAFRETAVQWGGVGGRAWIAGQEFTADALGDTAIRKDAQAIFCHPLSDEYASFLFPKDTRAQRMVQQIGRRECIYKDSDNVVKRIITPAVPDEEIDVMVAYLQRSIPRQVPQRRQTQQMQQRPPTQPLQRASRQLQQQGASFYMARTEDLAPKPPAPFPQRRTAPAPGQQPAASATWEYDDTPRQQYGAASRTLHRNRLTAQSQTQQPAAQQMNTTDDLSGWQPATGEPDDTVLVPESSLPPPAPQRQFMPRPTTGKIQAVQPATENLVSRSQQSPQVEPQSQAAAQPMDAQPDSVALLAKLRQQKGKRTKI